MVLASLPQDLCPLPNYFAPVRLEALANAMAFNNQNNKELEAEASVQGARWVRTSMPGRYICAIVGFCVNVRLLKYKHGLKCVSEPLITTDSSCLSCRFGVAKPH